MVPGAIRSESDDSAANPKRGLGLIALFGAMASFFQGIHLDHLKHGTILIHPYYVGFYLASYQDGFRRRALVGSVLRLFFPRELNVVWLNVAALAVLCLLVTAALAAFLRLCGRVSPGGRALAFALCASPIIAVLVEIVGDTLQIAFLCFIAIVAVCGAYVKSPAARLLAGLLGLVLGFFIHEASIFFLAPCVPFLVRPWPRVREFIVPGLVAAGCFLLAMHWSNLAPHLTYEVKLFHFAGPLAEEPATPGFKALLHLEHDLYFSSRGAEVSFGMKCIKTVTLVFATLAALANCLSTRHFKRAVYMLCLMALFSLPLYCIAHDWGRFFAYSTVLALMVTAFAGDEGGATGGDRLESVAERFRAMAELEHMQLAVIFLLLTTVIYDNFEKVMLTPPLATFFAIVVAGFAHRRYTRSRNPAAAS